MFRSIRWRLVASYTLMTILAVTLVGVLALFLIERYLLHQERDYLTMNATAVAQQLEPMFQAQVARPALMDLARTTALFSDVQVRILDAQAQLLADSGQPAQDPVTLVLSQPATTMTTGDVASASGEAGVWVQVLPAQPAVAPIWNWHQNVDRTTPDGQQPLPPMVVFRRGTELRNAPAFVFDTQAFTAAAMGVAVQAVPAQATTGDMPYTVETVAAQRWFGLGNLLDTILPEPQSVIKAVGNNGNVVGYVELRSEPDFAAAALLLIRRSFLLAGLGVSLLAMLVALWMSRSLTAPLHDLIQTTEQMRGGALSARASVRTHDEIGLLATQFNTMAARLESSFAELAAERDALRRFVADASHELRTPITALKTFGELLLGPAGELTATRLEFLQESQKQIQRLEWMTSALLKLSRLDAGLTELKTEAIDLRDLLTVTSKPFLARAQEKAVTLTVLATPEPVLAFCNPSYLEMALANLLDNALKFTPTGGTIQVGVALAALPAVSSEGPAQDAWVELWVDDNGVGIAPEDLPYIFDRFYRGLHSVAPSVDGHLLGAAYAQPQRTSTIAVCTGSDGGCGLGLAIVQSIVKAHQGQVAVQSKIGVGSRFVVKLPLTA